MAGLQTHRSPPMTILRTGNGDKDRMDGYSILRGRRRREKKDRMDGQWGISGPGRPNHAFSARRKPLSAGCFSRRREKKAGITVRCGWVSPCCPRLSYGMLPGVYPIFLMFHPEEQLSLYSHFRSKQTLLSLPALPSLLTQVIPPP